MCAELIGAPEIHGNPADFADMPSSLRVGWQRHEPNQR
jgi:hypothetical protein